MNSNKKSKSAAQLVAEKLLGKEKAQWLHAVLLPLGEQKSVLIRNGIGIVPYLCYKPQDCCVKIRGVPGVNVVHAASSFDGTTAEFLWRVLVFVSIENPRNSMWVRDSYDGCIVI